MPYKPLHPCRQPGCPELISADEKYCKKHKKMHPEEIRSAASRGYDRRWQKMSKAYLQAHPLCEECLRHGRYTKATQVDHIVPHRGDPKLLYSVGNLQSLCQSCHSRKTRNEDEYPVYHY